VAAAPETARSVVRKGHVEEVTDNYRGRASGIRVSGVNLEADLVLDTSGRAR